MMLSKTKCFLLITFVFAQMSQASVCFYNEVTKDQFSNPGENYKLWALQKICFDEFLNPSKISTEDDLFRYTFYSQVSRQIISLPTGGRQLKLTALDKNDSSRSLFITINLSIDESPLALISKTSDDFELITSL